MTNPLHQLAPYAKNKEDENEIRECPNCISALDFMNKL